MQYNLIHYTCATSPPPSSLHARPRDRHSSSRGTPYTRALTGISTGNTRFGGRGGEKGEEARGSRGWRWNLVSARRVVSSNSQRLVCRLVYILYIIMMVFVPVLCTGIYVFCNLLNSICTYIHVYVRTRRVIPYGPVVGVVA